MDGQPLRETFRGGVAGVDQREPSVERPAISPTNLRELDLFFWGSRWSPPAIRWKWPTNSLLARHINRQLCLIFGECARPGDGWATVDEFELRRC